MTIPISELPSHLGRLVRNLQDVTRLTEIHTQLSGKSPGRKHGVEVLNKSAIVLLVACWESFIEGLATNSFDALLKRARTPQVFPNKVLALSGTELKQQPNDTAIWTLAGHGWRSVLQAHRDEVLERHVGKLNTPKPEQINSLFECLIGLKDVTRCWSYRRMTPNLAARKLTELVVLRGDIAHKVTTSASVQKATVKYYIDFIGRLAGLTSNRVGGFVEERTHHLPWEVNITYEPDW
jgi:hypothetical protein